MVNSTMHFLLGRFLDTEYSEKLLANVSADSFDRLREDLFCRFGDDGITDADIKAAWKEWFDWAVSNGTLVHPELRFENKSNPIEHSYLRVHELLLELAYNAIDRL